MWPRSAKLGPHSKAKQSNTDTNPQDGADRSWPIDCPFPESTVLDRFGFGSGVMNGIDICVATQFAGQQAIVDMAVPASVGGDETHHGRLICLDGSVTQNTKRFWELGATRMFRRCWSGRLRRFCRECSARRGLVGVSPASSRCSRALGTASSVVCHAGGRGLCHFVWVSRDSAR